MSYIRCPYCNQSDGNDDKIVNKRIEGTEEKINYFWSMSVLKFVCTSEFAQI